MSSLSRRRQGALGRYGYGGVRAAVRAVVAAVAIGAAGCSPTQAPPSVVFIGDSITRLWEGLPMEWENAGVDGNTTAQMFERFQVDVLDRSPKTVVILGGTNDIYLKARPGIENILFMANLAAERGICVIIGRIPQIYFQAGSKSLEQIQEDVRLWNDQIDALTGQYRRVDYFSIFDGHPELFADGLHPNDEGYERMLEAVQPDVVGCSGL